MGGSQPVQETSLSFRVENQSSRLYIKDLRKGPGPATVVPFTQTLSLPFACVPIHKGELFSFGLVDHSYHHHQRPSTAVLLSLEGGMAKPESTEPSIAQGQPQCGVLLSSPFFLRQQRGKSGSRG